MTKIASISRDIYSFCLYSRYGDLKCYIKEGIVFAFHKEWDSGESHGKESDGRESDIAEGIETEENIEENAEEKQWLSAYERYAKERLGRSEYRHIKIGLERLARAIALIEGSWQRTSRHHALRELVSILNRQHELEEKTESIEDIFLREYIYEQLDIITAARRSLAEEVRWDIESEKKIQGIQ